jgi:allophanate hydrolase subunit 2
MAMTYDPPTLVSRGPAAISTCGTEVGSTFDGMLIGMSKVSETKANGVLSLQRTDDGTTTNML